MLLAERFARDGASVTLLLGPAGPARITGNRFRVIRFRFFDELSRVLLAELRRRPYDVVIHSAAVSDYRPVEVSRKKIPSDLRTWDIRLERTPKIIERIKASAPGAILVGFKFEPRARPGVLIKEARALIDSAQADLVVANTVTRQGYRACIVGRHADSCILRDKRSMARRLVQMIGRGDGKDSRLW